MTLLDPPTPPLSTTPASTQLPAHSHYGTIYNEDTIDPYLAHYISAYYCAFESLKPHANAKKAKKKTVTDIACMSHLLGFKLIKCSACEKEAVLK